MAWLALCVLLGLFACQSVEPVSGELLTTVAGQLPDDAVLLLPTAAETAVSIETLDLSQTDEATLRPILQEVVSLYLLIEPDSMALYEETAVANIRWVQNHSEPVELTQYEDGHVLYWVVVTQGHTFNPHPLRVAPGG